MHHELERLVTMYDGGYLGLYALEAGDQIFLRDPDGVRVQLADVQYKR